MDGTYYYEIREYKPYRASRVTVYLPAVHMTQPVGVSHARGYWYNDVAVSKNRRRNDGRESDLISGLCLSYSRSVGIV